MARKTGEKFSRRVSGTPWGRSPDFIVRALGPFHHPACVNGVRVRTNASAIQFVGEWGGFVEILLFYGKLRGRE